MEKEIKARQGKGKRVRASATWKSWKPQQA